MKYAEYQICLCSNEFGKQTHVFKGYKRKNIAYIVVRIRIE